MNYTKKSIYNMKNKIDYFYDNELNTSRNLNHFLGYLTKETINNVAANLLIKDKYEK